MKNVKTIVKTDTVEENGQIKFIQDYIDSEHKEQLTIPLFLMLSEFIHNHEEFAWVTQEVSENLNIPDLNIVEVLPKLLETCLVNNDYSNTSFDTATTFELVFDHIRDDKDEIVVSEEYKLPVLKIEANTQDKERIILDLYTTLLGMILQLSLVVIQHQMVIDNTTDTQLSKPFEQYKFNKELIIQYITSFLDYILIYAEDVEKYNILNNVTYGNVLEFLSEVYVFDYIDVDKEWLGM